MSTDCEICYEKFNNSNHKKVPCCSCDSKICRTCVQNYLKNTTEMPHCHKCKTGWTLEYLSTVTPKSFHNLDYRKYRTSIALDREKGLLVEAQPAVENIILDRKNRLELTGLYLERNTFATTILPKFDDDPEIVETNKEIGKIQKKLDKLHKQIEDRRLYLNRDSNTRKDFVHNRIRELEMFLRGGARTEERKQFIKACPMDDCRGFLSTAWKCGICETWICKDCHVKKEEKDDANHVCDKEAVETAKMIAMETKPCPNCAVPIYKTEGCDQLWCTLCHTPFSWATGRKVTGVIHNPHFYEWQRQQNNGVAPRVAGDIVCGGLPDIIAIDRHLLAEKISIRQIPQKDINNRHRLINHILHVDIPHYPTDQGDSFRDLRIRYLLKDISQEGWISGIQKNEKKFEKNNAVCNVLRMFTTVMTDMFNNILTKKGNEIIDMWEDMEKLRKYTNNNLEKIYSRFDNITPYISKNWASISIAMKDKNDVIDTTIWNNRLEMPVANEFTRLDADEDNNVIIGPSIIHDTGYCLANMFASEYSSSNVIQLLYIKFKLTASKKVGKGSYEIHIYTPIVDTLGQDVDTRDSIFRVGSRVRYQHKNATIFEIKERQNKEMYAANNTNLYSIVYDDSKIEENIELRNLFHSDSPVPARHAFILENKIKFDIYNDTTTDDSGNQKYLFKDPIVVNPGQVMAVVNTNGPLEFTWDRLWDLTDILVFNYYFGFNWARKVGDIVPRINNTIDTRPGFYFGVKI